ncbi:MAG TPA: hypothetical protein VME44_17530 [Streptosporangiaceae bacterium]|nr:hypothetical protein [Streptosporangiaceae bacterium]
MGLLDRRPGYYRVKISLAVVAFFAGWALFVLAGNSWTTVAPAAVLGVLFTQPGFIGHDAGHNRVFGTRQCNRTLGLIVANTLIGLSWPRAARWRAPLFFPLMVLRSSGMHVLGMKRLRRRRDRAAAVEAGLIVLHAALYLTVVLWVLSPLRALAFIAVQQAVFSMYLGISFAPDHKAMPIIGATTAAGFARRQVGHHPEHQGRPAHHFLARSIQAMMPMTALGQWWG